METLSSTLALLSLFALLFWHQYEKNRHLESAYLSLKKRMNAMSQLDDLNAAINDNTTQLGLLATAIGQIPAQSVPPDLSAAIATTKANTAQVATLVTQAQALATPPAAPAPVTQA